MTAKEYLNGARLLDLRINDKLDQVRRLHALATKATQTLSDMPESATKNNRKMENIIVKILELENSINEDIDRLVILKKQMMSVLGEIEKDEYRVLLEKRYLNNQPWDRIADDMNCSIDNVYKLHGKALKEVNVPQ